jgi:hypothetical protein
MRTPADTYPNDPYFNENFEPYGWGALTNVCLNFIHSFQFNSMIFLLLSKVGKQSCFELGEFLRARYDDFLGQQTNVGVS